MHDSTDRAMSVSNGEGYRFRAVDFGIEGLKIELYDSCGYIEAERCSGVVNIYANELVRDKSWRR